MTNPMDSRPTSVVTGGAGFLGSHLTDRLLVEGHRVIAIDNLITGNVANIEHLSGHEEFHFIKQDISEYIYLPGPVDYVFHFASPASPFEHRLAATTHRSVERQPWRKTLAFESEYLSKRLNLGRLIERFSEVSCPPISIVRRRDEILVILKEFTESDKHLARIPQ